MFNATMRLSGASAGAKCWAFPLSLEDSALQWFSNLEPRSIGSYPELVDQFKNHFSTNRKVDKPPTALLAVRQREGETLRGYLNRLQDEVAQVKRLTTEGHLMALIGGLRGGTEFEKWARRERPRTLAYVMEKANVFMDEEEDELARKKAGKRQREEKKTERSSQDRSYVQSYRPVERDERRDWRERGVANVEQSQTLPRRIGPPRQIYDRYTPLTASPTLGGLVGLCQEGDERHGCRGRFKGRAERLRSESSSDSTDRHSAGLGGSRIPSARGMAEWSPRGRAPAIEELHVSSGGVDQGGSRARWKLSLSDARPLGVDIYIE